MKRSRQNAFTLVELLVAMFVMAVVAATMLGIYRRGLLIDTEQSKLERTLITALNAARMRALNNQNAVTITSGQAVDYNVGIGMYEHVQFTTANHGFATGDTVTFSRLDKHSGMNGGVFYMTVLDANTFKCPYYTKLVVNDTTGVARSLNKSSMLTIKKKPSPPLADSALISQYGKEAENQAFFYYEGRALTVWDATNLVPGSAAFTTAQAAAQAIEPGAPSPTQWPNTTTATVAFNSRGAASNPNGYLLVVDRRPTKQDSQKYIRIGPSGKIRPGY
ncbi:MAG: prepilin-type N-terminal cleavage/methylation domain-containing protein [Desulfomonile tiedjei]|nr:prepilin-type N-terminal cleavage/methylation domain-containing protein [Desulfomonile tiedjei]